MQSVTTDSSILSPRFYLELCLCAVQDDSFGSSTHTFMFTKRKTLLQTLRADDLSLLESAPKRWKSLESSSAEDRITGDPVLYDVNFIVMLLF